MTHLILHKVRGEPAFDIAEMMEVGDEAWWIIPTSGHRAYPYRSWQLSKICARDDHMYRSITNFKDQPPPGWPDHYQNEDTGHITSGVNVMAIVSKLLPKIKRRL